MSSGERPYFFRSRLRCAVLNVSGKVPSCNDKLISLVKGAESMSTQDLSSFVGIQSRRQVESEDLEIRAVTSSTVAGEKDDNTGG